MDIRQARRSDIPALAALAKETYSEAFGHSVTPADLADQLEATRSESYFDEAIDEDTILVATAQDRLVGYLQFGPARIPVEGVSSRDQELRRLFVLSAFQRRGLGTSLLEAALAHPGLANAENIYLDVWDENVAAWRLYESYDFKVVGRVDFVIGARVLGQDLVMVRRRAPNTATSSGSAAP
jgi:diamine N-acetyltransferase